VDDARSPFALETACCIAERIRARQSGLVASSTTNTGLVASSTTENLYYEHSE
jgi:hypothetical protein